MITEGQLQQFIDTVFQKYDTNKTGQLDTQ